MDKTLKPYGYFIPTGIPLNKKKIPDSWLRITNHVLKWKTPEVQKEVVCFGLFCLSVCPSSETTMLINICNALCVGLIKPWLPQPPKTKDLVKDKMSDAGDALDSPKGKGGKAAAAPAKKTATIAITISSDAMPDLKKAIEVKHCYWYFYNIPQCDC